LCAALTLETLFRLLWMNFLGNSADDRRKDYDIGGDWLAE
jgi:hypothetical protein